MVTAVADAPTSTKLRAIDTVDWDTSTENPPVDPASSLMAAAVMARPLTTDASLTVMDAVVTAAVATNRLPVIVVRVTVSVADCEAAFQ